VYAIRSRESLDFVLTERTYALFA